jgi:RNA polymerase sigma factor (sigma-70 family)
MAKRRKKRAKPLAEMTNEELAVAAQAGDLDARNQLWVANMGIVYKIANRFTAYLRAQCGGQSSMDVDDVASTIAMDALPVAVKYYEPGRSKWSTFFTNGVRFAALRLVRTELAKTPQISESECVHELEIVDPDSDDSGVDQSELFAELTALRDSFSSLSKRARTIVERRTKRHQLDRIAEDLCVSRERVRQIERLSLEKLAIELGADPSGVRSLATAARGR